MFSTVGLPALTLPYAALWFLGWLELWMLNHMSHTRDPRTLELFIVCTHWIPLMAIGKNKPLGSGDVFFFFTCFLLLWEMKMWTAHLRFCNTSSVPWLFWLDGVTLHVYMLFKHLCHSLLPPHIVCFFFCSTLYTVWFIQAEFSLYSFTDEYGSAPSQLKA